MSTQEDEVPNELNERLVQESESEHGEESNNGASFNGAVFNLITTIIGAVIMALPATMKILGIVPGIVMIILKAFLTDTTIEFLLRFSGGMIHVMNHLPALILFSRETRVKGSFTNKFSILTYKVTAPVTRAQSRRQAHINLVSEPNDSMGDTEALSKQMAKMMEMMQSMNAKIDYNMTTQNENMLTLQERMIRHETATENRGKAIKFSTEELSEVEILDRSKGSKGLRKNIPVRSYDLVNESNYGFSGGPWPHQAVGRERGHRRTDGGGDWNVRPIGAAPHDSNQNSGDYRNTEGLIEGGYYETREDRSNHFERRCVKAAKIEFPPLDGTTDAMEWLQKCDDFFADQRIFSDDTKVRQATFVLTGQAYHWNLNLR
ncbi:hypothetical protein Rs2_35506 [Raphanus sativus]|nr:hypothetical protein Rs2_35506 [Raphanus sativus]